jgi:hypothetical protein
MNEQAYSQRLEEIRKTKVVDDAVKTRSHEVTSKKLDETTKELIKTKHQLDYERAQKAEYCRLRAVFLRKNAEAHKALADLNGFADEMQKHHHNLAQWEIGKQGMKSATSDGRKAVADEIPVKELVDLTK